ncbi:hypothetical protein [Aquabacterium humicola]|uniref:hypothetical protein n=1 Tax=Aquabacterium humicola TaxID=3237377 RepID=UPI0025436938|nr:hypothetical protein [Rubrivivax pictus]
MKNRAGAWLGAALAFVLAACGGGGGDSGSTDRAPSAPPAAPATTTLADYLKSRADRVTVMGYPEPSAEERAWLFDDSRERAVAQVARSLVSWPNAVALPPLQASFVQTVGAAARGDTLAELRQAHPGVAPGFYASMRRTAGVHRELSALTGTRLLPEFLAATDSFGPLPPLAHWSAEEVADPRGLSSHGSDVRLVVSDRINVDLALPRGEAYEGLVVGADGSRSSLAVLELTDGVVQHRAADYAAQALRVGQHLLVKIEPAVVPLRTFAESRLSAALSEVVHTVGSPTLVALPPGKMLLPRQGMSVDGREASSNGLASAFDELRADLRGLDGGGTYLKADNGPSGLWMEAGALSMYGSHTTTFIHSIRNPHAPDTSSGGSVLVNPVTCPERVVALRPFFIVVLDADRRVVALAAMGAIASTACWSMG